MNVLFSSLILAAAVCLPCRISAQSTKELPESAKNADCNTSSFYPFSSDKGRFQQLIAASAITDTAATVRSFTYRRDTQSINYYTGRTIENLSVWVGYTNKTQRTMSQTFADNRGSRALVFSGKYDLPSIKPVKTAPWNLTIKFTSPFSYERSKGNLLIEMEMPGVASRRYLYAVDAHRGSGGGIAISFGKDGPFASKDAYRVFSSNDYLMYPGGRLSINASGLKSAYPTLLVLGLSKTKFGALPLPFDLGPFGGTNQNLYVSLDLAVPVVPSKNSATYEVHGLVPVPDVKLTASLSLFAQFLFLDKPSNPLGLIGSSALELKLDPDVGSPSQSVGTIDSKATRGAFGLGTLFIGGPAIQLEGGGFNN